VCDTSSGSAEAVVEEVEICSPQQRVPWPYVPLGRRSGTS